MQQSRHAGVRDGTNSGDCVSIVMRCPSIGRTPVVSTWNIDVGGSVLTCCARCTFPFALSSLVSFSGLYFHIRPPHSFGSAWLLVALDLAIDEATCLFIPKADYLFLFQSRDSQDIYTKSFLPGLYDYSSRQVCYILNTMHCKLLW